MKKLILSELILLFLATTFVTDSPPPGWYQQTLPVNKLVTDIHFIDSLKGWSVTSWDPQFDSSYILYTTNAGTNWSVQWSYHASFTAIQMVGINTGYVTGGTGTGRLFKTTNGGANWNLIYSGGHLFGDLFFVNQDTGWISDEDVSGSGLSKTTNGGQSWIQQLSGSFRPTKLFFINRDTGWVACQNVNLYRTTNGGSVWTLQHSFPQQINDIYYLNKDTGIVSSGFNHRTSDGGFNWTQSNDGGVELSFGNDSVGWAGNTFIYIQKTTNGGISWFRQLTNINNPSTTATDTLLAWAGGNGVVHTTDGGGPPAGIIKINNEVPSSYRLYQNYPNPFNPITTIRFQISGSADIKLTIYDIQGKEVAALVNQKHTIGTYETEFDGSAYSSGIYFYSLIADGKLIETKKMILIK